MSQNKSVTQLDVFLLILCIYRFFGFNLWWNLGIFFHKKHHGINRSFALIKLSRPRLALRSGCGNKTMFCPALIGCFKREMTSSDHLVGDVGISSNLICSLFLVNKIIMSTPREVKNLQSETMAGVNSPVLW